MFTQVFKWSLNIHSTGFPCDSAGKESTCNVGNLSSTPGLGRSPGEGKGYPLQYSSLENSMECKVHGVAKSGSLCQSMQIKYECSYSLVFLTQRFVHDFKHLDFLSHLTMYPEISPYQLKALLLFFSCIVYHRLPR